MRGRNGRGSRSKCCHPFSHFFLPFCLHHLLFSLFYFTDLFILSCSFFLLVFLPAPQKPAVHTSEQIQPYNLNSPCPFGGFECRGWTAKDEESALRGLAAVDEEPGFRGLTGMV